METNNTELKNAINFLLFSYFGITFESKPDNILDKAISKAYKDATLRGAFNTQLTDELKEKIIKAKNDVENNLGENLIKEHVNALIKNTPHKIIDKECFNEWHSSLCQKLIECYKTALESDYYFTYGNAQKWVNMTMKYLYLLNSIFSVFAKPDTRFIDSYGKHIDKISEFLHVPVDSYIIESVWYEDSIKLPLKKEKLSKNGKHRTYNSENVVAWSKWNNNDQEYDDFQNSLKDYLSEKNEPAPIAWEGPAWIKVAKERKKNNK